MQIVAELLVTLLDMIFSGKRQFVYHISQLIH